MCLLFGAVGNRCAWWALWSGSGTSLISGTIRSFGVHHLLELRRKQSSGCFCCAANATSLASLFQVWDRREWRSGKVKCNWCRWVLALSPDKKKAGEEEGEVYMWLKRGWICCWRMSDLAYFLTPYLTLRGDVSRLLWRPWTQNTTWQMPWISPGCLGLVCSGNVVIRCLFIHLLIFSLM